MGNDRWPPNARLVQVRVHGPDPRTVAMVDRIDVIHGRALAGANGVVRIGEPSSMSRKFSGELGALQRFRGAAFLGVSRNVRRGENRALPNTHGPMTAVNRMADLLERTQHPDRGAGR